MPTPTTCAGTPSWDSLWDGPGRRTTSTKLVAVHAYSDINEFCGVRTHDVWYGRKINCNKEMEAEDPPCGE